MGEELDIEDSDAFFNTRGKFCEEIQDGALAEKEGNRESKQDYTMESLFEKSPHQDTLLPLRASYNTFECRSLHCSL